MSVVNVPVKLNRPTTDFLHLSVNFPLPVTKGKYFLGSLFYETPDLRELSTPIADDLGGRPLFTLKVYDYPIPPDSRCFRKEGPNTLKSLHQLFVEAEDPSEYNFAVQTFGSYEHWEALTECLFFQPYLKKMRKTLETRLDAKTVLAAKQAIELGTGAVALQAAKWLNSRVVRSGGPKRGRPSGEEIEGELKRQANERADVEADLTRVNG